MIWEPQTIWKHRWSEAQIPWSAGHSLQVPQVASHHGGPVRWAELPSPSRSRWWLLLKNHPQKVAWRGMQAFREPHPLTWSKWGLGKLSKWSRTEEDLECLPPLDPHLEGFLAEAEGGDDSQLTLSPEPSFNNSSEWVKWHAKQLKTPTWWWELSKVPSQMDVQEFVRWVQALFQLPKVSSCTQGVANDYLVLLAPSLWTVIGSYLFPIWGLVGRITTWGSPRRPWHMPRPCSIGWKKSSCCHWVSLTKWGRVCWSSSEPWNP